MSDDTSLEVYDRPPDGGADYILQMKIKNGPLLRAIRMRGYKTITAFHVASKIDQNTIHAYLSLRRAPINKWGEWKRSALRMAKYLRLPPDSLFPEQHLERVMAVTSGEVDVSAQELLMIMAPDRQETPEDVMIRQEKHDAVVKALQQLTPRQERVLRLRFGIDVDREQTLDEVAAQFNVTRERLRQIEDKALRSLKHPIRSRALRRAWGEELALCSLYMERPQTHCGPVYTDEEIAARRKQIAKQKQVSERRREWRRRKSEETERCMREHNEAYNRRLADHVAERHELLLRIESTDPWWEHRPQPGNAVRCQAGFVVNEADENNPVFRARDALVEIARRDGLVLFDWKP